MTGHRAAATLCHHPTIQVGLPPHPAADARGMQNEGQSTMALTPPVQTLAQLGIHAARPLNPKPKTLSPKILSGAIREPHCPSPSHPLSLLRTVEERCNTTVLHMLRSLGSRTTRCRPATWRLPAEVVAIVKSSTRRRVMVLAAMSNARHSVLPSSNSAPRLRTAVPLVHRVHVRSPRTGAYVLSKHGVQPVA